MRTKLRAMAARQGGIFTRAQALEVGYGETEIRTLTRTDGPWVIVRRGAFCEREVIEALDRFEGRRLLRDKAASTLMSVPHLLSHDSAARLLGSP